MDQTKRIREIADQILEQRTDLFIVDLEVKGNPGNQRVVLLMDGDNGLTIDDCSSTSRQIARIVEEEDLFSGKYNLEVSSPGADAPLKLPRQFERNVGRNIKVESHEGDKKKGELISVGENSIELKIDEEIINFSLDEIKKANVIVSFN